MAKRIIIDYYPATIYFDVKKQLPPFEYGCKVRQEILLRQLKRWDVNSPCHAYSDYIIEAVDPYYDGEIWIIGS